MLNLRELTPAEEQDAITYLATRPLNNLMRRAKLLNANLKIQFRKKNMTAIRYIQLALEHNRAAQLIVVGKA